MDYRGFAPTVGDGNLNQDVSRAGLGVFDEKIKIAVIIEYPSINQFVFGILFAASPVLLAKIRIRKLPLRTLIKHFEIGVRRSRVQVIIELFDIFSVVSLLIVQPEKALFQNRIFPIPKRLSVTEELV